MHQPPPSLDREGPRPGNPLASKTAGAPTAAGTANFGEGATSTDNFAFPSEQRLHVVSPNGSYQLISAAGDKHNTSGYPIDPATPPRLAAHRNVQPLVEGFVNPTLPPYNAAGDGVADDAAALQAAINDAYSSRMTVLLPEGHTFLCSTQLTFVQPPNVSGRAYGYAMIGGRSDRTKARPVLKLKDGAPTANWLQIPHNGTMQTGGQGNCDPRTIQDCTPSVFLLYQYLETRTINNDTLRAETFYLARLRGIDIDVGNNPAVSAVSMNSAQLASIEDVRIHGIAFHAGFNGLPGSGGFSANLEVVGGDYGVVQNQERPNPSIVGLRLSAQRLAGVVIDVSKGPLVLSGFTIESTKVITSEQTKVYRAVLLRSPNPGQDNSFAGEDGSIVLHTSSGGTAIESIGGADVTLKNVYFVGARTVAMCSQTNLSLLSGGSAADPGPAVRVAHYVLTASGGHVNNYGVIPPYSRNGSALSWLSAPLQRGEAAAPLWKAGTLPLLHSWNYSALPSWDDPRSKTLNVMTQYGATPQWVNATDDDGVKIQSAIDDACNSSTAFYGAVVFIPHGEYGIAAPLDLHDGCAHVVGAGPHSVTLATLQQQPDPNPDLELPLRSQRRQNSSGDCWPRSPSAGTRAMITSQMSNNGYTYNGEQLMRLISGFNIGTTSGCPCIDLRAGKFLFRDVGIRDNDPWSNAHTVDPEEQSGTSAVDVCKDYPYVALRNGVSGRFYGLPLDIVDVRQCEAAPHHVLLLIDGCHENGGEIHLYQASTEHLINVYQTLINSSTCGVHFHSWKYENALHARTSIPPYGSGSLVRIEGRSRDVSVFGAAGNYHVYNESIAIVDIASGSRNVSMMGMSRRATRAEPKVGLKWLVDRDSSPISIVGGYNALLFYRS